jgi:hypothetical protein
LITMVTSPATAAARGDLLGLGDIQTQRGDVPIGHGSRITDAGVDLGRAVIDQRERTRGGFCPKDHQHLQSAARRYGPSAGTGRKRTTAGR